MSFNCKKIDNENNENKGNKNKNPLYYSPQKSEFSNYKDISKNVFLLNNLNDKKNDNNLKYENEIQEEKSSDNNINLNIPEKNMNNEEPNIMAKILGPNEVKDYITKSTINFIEEKESNNDLSSVNSEEFKKTYNEPGNFNFFIISDKVKSFKFESKNNINNNDDYEFNNKENFSFIDINNCFRLIINIIIDDDSLESSKNLRKIFNNILISLLELDNVNIKTTDILICLYFQYFSSNKTFSQIFPNLDFYFCNNTNEYFCSYGNVISGNDTPLTVLSFYKPKSTLINIYKFFYCEILNELLPKVNLDQREIGKTLLIVNWTNGKKYKTSINKHHKGLILADIVRISNKRNMIVIPDIYYYPFNDKDWLGYIHKYNLEDTKNITNHEWEMLSFHPIDHRFNFINMNYSFFLLLKEFYQYNICDYAHIYYHDYKMSLFLNDNSKEVKIHMIKDIKIEYKEIPYNFVDVFFDFIHKKSSEFANVFNLIQSIFSFKQMTFLKFIKKIFTLFKICSLLWDFFWLSFSIMIIYAVLNDAIIQDSVSLDYFVTFFFGLLAILSLSLSLSNIKNKPKIKKNIIQRNQYRKVSSKFIFVLIYIFHYIYFMFFIVSSIIALINIKSKGSSDISHIQKTQGYYTFSNKKFLSLLIANVCLYIIPIFFRPSNFLTKGFVFYLLIEFPTLLNFFYFPYIILPIKHISSKNLSLENIYIFAYIILNSAMTMLSLALDDNRNKRLDFFYSLATIYCVLNSVRLLSIIIGYIIEISFKDNINAGEEPGYIINDYPKESKSPENNNNDSKILDKEINRVQISENNNLYSFKDNDPNKKLFGINLKDEKFNNTNLDTCGYSSPACNIFKHKLWKNNNLSDFLDETIPGDNKLDDIKGKSVKNCQSDIIYKKKFIEKKNDDNK